MYSPSGAKISLLPEKIYSTVSFFDIRNVLRVLLIFQMWIGSMMIYSSIRKEKKTSIHIVDIISVVPWLTLSNQIFALSCEQKFDIQVSFCCIHCHSQLKFPVQLHIKQQEIRLFVDLTKPHLSHDSLLA